MESTELELLTETYNVANAALRASDLFLAKEAAGAALQAAHEGLKAERIAARAATQRARTIAPTPDILSDFTPSAPSAELQGE